MQGAVRPWLAGKAVPLAEDFDKTDVRQQGGGDFFRVEVALVRIDGQGDACLLQGLQELWHTRIGRRFVQVTLAVDRKHPLQDRREPILGRAGREAAVQKVHKAAADKGFVSRVIVPGKAVFGQHLVGTVGNIGCCIK